MTKMDLHVYLIDHSIPGKPPRFCVQLCTDNEMIDTADMFTVSNNENGELVLEFDEICDTDIRYFISKIKEYLLSVPEYVKSFRDRINDYHVAIGQQIINEDMEKLEALARKLGKKVIDDNEGCL